MGTSKEGLLIYEILANTKVIAEKQKHFKGKSVYTAVEIIPGLLVCSVIAEFAQEYHIINYEKNSSDLICSAPNEIFCIKAFNQVDERLKNIILARETN